MRKPIMKMFVCVVWLTLWANVGPARGQLRIETGRDAGEPLTLAGRDSRSQILVSDDRRAAVDVTRVSSFESVPADVVSVDPAGYLTPLRDGETTLTATLDGVQTEPLKIVVTGFDADLPVHFTNQVVPIFTKLTCNGGGCHGKAAGQNGFRLSLLGFTPRDDYEFLVYESRGRRLNPAAPDQSLLLTKATSEVAHGGGQRLDRDSDEYRLIRRWIAQGMPYGSDDDPRVEAITVYPAHQLMARESQQQLMVLARYTDGRIEDVTRMAQFESNDPEMADVSVRGLVNTQNLAGDVTVMTRFQGQVAVFRATMPLSDQPITLPASDNLVDRAVFAKLTELGIPLSAPADDPTFIRRLTLDLAGRLPTPAEATEFAADVSNGQRDRLIQRLLASNEHASYFAAKWSQILRNRRNNEAFKYGSFAFHRWLREQLRVNRPYDEMVRDIVAASGSLSSHPPVAWYRQVTDINQQVEDTSQLFLGQRVQCARCHHHPYEKWSQEDYARMSGFFSLVSHKQGTTASEPIVYSRLGSPGAADPRGGPQLTPAGLGGEPIAVDETLDPRHQLVDWMTDPANPYFARSLVNRYWKHFFGRGLVDPEDDMRVTNPASNPELLDALAQSFVDSGFDMRALIRTIVSSNTYQLSGDPNGINVADKRNHARFYPKRLTAEVLLDAIDDTLGTTTQFDAMPAGTRAVMLPDTSFSSYFLTVFGRPEATTACECERESDANLAQSLHLLNSKQMQEKLTDPQGISKQFGDQIAALRTGDQEPDAAAVENLNETLREQISNLYLRALSRYPTPEEQNKIFNYLQEQPDLKFAYEDVLWAIINSKEFLFNH